MKAHLVLYLGVLLCGIGMMLIVASVIIGGLFRAGAVLILIGMLACGVAGVLHVVSSEADTRSAT